MTLLVDTEQILRTNIIMSRHYAHYLLIVQTLLALIVQYSVLYVDASLTCRAGVDF